MHKGGINKCYPPRITTEPRPSSKSVAYSSTLRDLTHPLWKLEDKCVVYERN